MQADSTLPEAQRRHYRNAFHALYRIVREEGVTYLWKGATPTVVRAVFINLAMLAPYDECKERISKYLGYTKKTYIISSLIAGFLGAFFLCFSG
jgi:solute carrier family 25 (mitochondrial oxoglutarate transporter), member 11